MMLRQCAFRSGVPAVMVAFFLASCFGGGGRRPVRAAADPAYAKTLRARFYEAWVPPQGVVATRDRISVPVDVQIDGRGRVARFKIAQSSGIRAVDESIEAIRTELKQVDPPPTASGGGRFELRINFELDVKG